MNEPTSESPIEVEARGLVGGDRKQSYGDARESFDRIAQVWSAILKTPVTGQQVALCMAGLKLCREANQPKRDNRVDAIGYVILADEALQ